MATDIQQPLEGSKEIKVQSSQTVGTPLTAAARKKRYNELRARLGESKLKVVGEKGKHYFFADKNDNGEMIRLESVGYAIVREPNAKKVLAGEMKPKIQASGLREDGTYVIGDVMLMECSDELYEFMQLDIEERHAALINSATEDFRSEAAKTGVPTFDVDK
jgi:phage portal protein BeeE